VARFAGGDVDAEDGGVDHSPQTDKRAIQIGNRDDHAGAPSRRQANRGARLVRSCFGIVHNGFDFSSGQASDWAIRDGNQVAFRRLTLASCRPVAWKIGASSAHWTRGYSSWTSSLIDEGKSDAADENCARIRKGQRKSEVVAGSGPHRDGAV